MIILPSIHKWLNIMGILRCTWTHFAPSFLVHQFSIISLVQSLHFWEPFNFSQLRCKTLSQTWESDSKKHGLSTASYIQLGYELTLYQNSNSTSWSSHSDSPSVFNICTGWKLLTKDSFYNLYFFKLTGTCKRS